MSDGDDYLDALEDDDTNERMSEEEEEEEPLPPCGPLQAALLGSFESAQGVYYEDDARRRP
jgi:hypothetical protein